MKKILVMLLAAILCVSIAACSAPAADAPAADAPAANVPAATGDFAVDVFIYNFADTYIADVRDSMQKQFEALGIKATFYDAANNQGNQTNQIETAITKGSGMLVVNIVTTGSEEASANIVNMAKEKDIPVVFFNREVSDEVVKSYDKCAFVGTDADEAGYMQGEMINKILSAKYEDYDLNKDGKIQYIMFKGELGNAEADGRTQYSVEEANRLLKEGGFEGLSYYDPANSDMFQACNWDSSLSQNAMSTALGTNPFTGDAPIEMVIANCDDMATGAIEALNEVGYNTGSDPMIPVVGVDATAVACAAIQDGKMSGTILQDAEGMAECVVHLANNIMNGKELMAETDSYIIDETVNKFRIPYGIYEG